MNINENFFSLCEKSKINVYDWFLLFNNPNISLSFADLNLLNNLGSLYNKILDIGTNDGVVALLMKYENNNIVYGIDKKISKPKFNDDFLNNIRFYFPFFNFIQLDITDQKAEHILNNIGHFDCIYIDSDIHVNDIVLQTFLSDKFISIVEDKFDIILSCVNVWEMFTASYLHEIIVLLKKYKYVDNLIDYVFYPTRIGYLRLMFDKNIISTKFKDLEYNILNLDRCKIREQYTYNIKETPTYMKHTRFHYMEKLSLVHKQLKEKIIMIT